MVELMFSVEEPVLCLLSDAWASHVANFATSRAIYSLFPKSVVRKVMYLFQAESELGWLFSEYVGAGFGRSEDVGLDKSVEMCSNRYVGDKFTSRVCFSDVGFRSFDEDLSCYRFSVREHGLRFAKEGMVGDK